MEAVNQQNTATEGSVVQRVPDLPPRRRRIRDRYPQGAGDPGLRVADDHCLCAAVHQGVINLRGIIVPIVDLRIKFGLGTVEYTPFTVVIILNIAQRVIGIVVDSVSDVTSLTGGQIRQAPDFSASFDTKYILGLATIDKRMLIVTDIERLMSSRDMELIDGPLRN